VPESFYGTVPRHLAQIHGLRTERYYLRHQDSETTQHQGNLAKDLVLAGKGGKLGVESYQSPSDGDGVVL